MSENDAAEKKGNSPKNGAIDQSIMFYSVIGVLTEREQKVLRLRYGMDDGRERSLEEIAKEFNVTKERIRQILNKAKAKLEKEARKNHLLKEQD